MVLASKAGAELVVVPLPIEEHSLAAQEQSKTHATLGQSAFRSSSSVTARDLEKFSKKIGAERVLSSKRFIDSRTNFVTRYHHLHGVEARGWVGGKQTKMRENGIQIPYQAQEIEDVYEFRATFFQGQAQPTTSSGESAPTVIYVQRVTLTTAYETDFRKERPRVTSGWLMVIKGRADVMAPRALAQPLLLAGGANWTESVEWFNHGHESGYRVCFIPHTTEESAKPEALATLRVWFGSPALPEATDAAMLAAERAKADVAKIASKPLSVTPTKPVKLADRDALVAAVQALVKRWSPDKVKPSGKE